MSHETHGDYLSSNGMCVGTATLPAVLLWPTLEETMYSGLIDIILSAQPSPEAASLLMTHPWWWQIEAEAGGVLRLALPVLSVISAGNCAHWVSLDMDCAESSSGRHSVPVLQSGDKGFFFYMVTGEIDTTFELVIQRRGLNTTPLLFLCCREPRSGSPGRRSK